MKKQTGFTLLELMIVVTVVGILTAIALPSYNNYVKRGKLVQATSGLSDGRVKMEQFFQDNRTYVGGPIPPATAYFTFATATTPATYTITATGQADMAAFAYTINEANVKTSTTEWGDSLTCWVSNKGEVC